MAYVKTVWVAGTDGVLADDPAKGMVISPARLDKLETGVETVDSALAWKADLDPTTGQVFSNLIPPGGTVGPAGPEGPIGPQGVPGTAGVKGDTGLKGDTGAVGPQGIQGVKGDTGATGATGPSAVDVAPQAHRASHATGGTDAITPASIGALRSVDFGSTPETPRGGATGTVLWTGAAGVTPTNTLPGDIVLNAT